MGLIILMIIIIIILIGEGASWTRDGRLFPNRRARILEPVDRRRPGSLS